MPILFEVSLHGMDSPSVSTNLIPTHWFFLMNRPQYPTMDRSHCLVEQRGKPAPDSKLQVSTPSPGVPSAVTFVTSPPIPHRLHSRIYKQYSRGQEEYREANKKRHCQCQQRSNQIRRVSDPTRCTAASFVRDPLTTLVRNTSSHSKVC